jgi:tRNA 2-selenouridine synthase
MIRSVTIEEFLELSKELSVIDVRSETEFIAGHIPNATNIPILNDEERKVVGTMYKQNGRKTAVYKGLELSGPNLSARLRQGVKLVNEGPVLVHCWRGGMRSEFYSFLLKFYGLEPILLQGGYKSYRTLVHETFEKQANYFVLGGKTGAGKTVILEHMKQLGEQVIDLEQLANHRGSAFGALGMLDQPTQEQFENNLYDVMCKLDLSKPIWIENENRTIGDKVIPQGLWQQMVKAKMFFVDREFEDRLDQIMKDYGSFKPVDLKKSMEKIGKRLGPQHVKRALELIDAGSIREAFEIPLGYYDKSYEFNLSKNEIRPSIVIDGKGLSYLKLAEQLQEIAKKENGKN